MADKEHSVFGKTISREMEIIFHIHGYNTEIIDEPSSSENEDGELQSVHTALEMLTEAHLLVSESEDSTDEEEHLLRQETDTTKHVFGKSISHEMEKTFPIPGYITDIRDEASSSGSEDGGEAHSVKTVWEMLTEAHLLVSESEDSTDEEVQLQRQATHTTKHVFGERISHEMERTYHIPGYNTDIIEEVSSAGSEYEGEAQSVKTALQMFTEADLLVSESADSTDDQEHLLIQEPFTTKVHDISALNVRSRLMQSGVSLSELQETLNTSDIHWGKITTQRQNYRNPESYIKESLKQQSSILPSTTRENLLNQFVESLKPNLHQNCPMGKGNFVAIGSIYAPFSTTLNRDFLYACPWPIIWSFYRTDSNKPFGKIFNAQGVKLDVQNLQKLFRDSIERAISNIALPEHFTFSGYGRPKYNGTRANGPAITCLLEDDRDPGKVITVDITLAFVAPETEKSAFIERLRSEPCWQSIQGLSDLCTGGSPILHVVPWINPKRKQYYWQLTTAVLETELPKSPEVENINRTIKTMACQLSLKSQKAVYDAIEVHAYSSDLLNELDECIQSEEHIKAQLGISLFDKHIYLPNYVEPIYHEKTKEIVSVSSAAVKFYVFGEIAKEQGSLGEDKCVRIVQRFFQRVPASVKHPFLFYEVRSVNLAPYVVDNIDDFYIIFKSRVMQLM